MHTGDCSNAEAEFRDALALYQKLADDIPAVTDFRSRLADSHHGIGWSMADADKPVEAEAEYRKALAIQQKLADDNPAVAEFRSRLADCHHQSRRPAVCFGQVAGGGGRASHGARDPAEACRRQPRCHRIPQPPGTQPQQARMAAIEHRQVIRSAVRVPQGNGTPTEVGRRAPHDPGASGGAGVQPGRNRSPPRAGRKFGRGDRLLQAGRKRSCRKLAESGSRTPDNEDRLADCRTNISDLLRRLGKLDEALAECKNAVAVREQIVAAHPAIPSYRANLGETYLRLGQVRRDMGDLTDAATALRRACVHYDAIKSPAGDSTFFRACCHAGLTGLGNHPGSGVSSAEGADHAKKAMADLCRAVSLGYRDPDSYRTESALDPLRNRPDFQALMVDLTFPKRPFAN